MPTEGVVGVAEEDSSDLDSVGLALDESILERIHRASVRLASLDELDADGDHACATREGGAETVVERPRDEDPLALVAQTRHEEIDDGATSVSLRDISE